MPKKLSLVKRSNIKAIERLKIGIWVYLLLLLFEGGLRKWVLPSLSNSLLIIRDPVAIWLLFTAYTAGIKLNNIAIKQVILITLFSFFFAITLGHGNIYVAIFGARITLLHFPLIFLIGKVFTRADVEKVGRFIVYLTIPMVILIAVQFYSPQNAFVNLGVGGNLEGAGFSGANGYFRPPGTFSFTAGNSLFFSFAAPFICFFMFFSNKMSKLTVYAAIICLLASIPLSISRSILFSIIVTLAFVISSFGHDSKRTGQIVGGIILFVLISYLLLQLNVLNDSLGAFTTRFTDASENEGGAKGIFIDRILAGVVNGISLALEGKIPFWGAGLGMGTNVGAQLLTGTQVFLIDEVEWGRIMGEMGLLLGLSYILVRVNLIYKMLLFSFNNMKKGYALGWLLLSFGFINVLQGQWGNPTGLGFGIISGGLILACANENDTFNAK